MSVHLRVGTHAGVEQDPSPGMIHEIAQARLDPRGSGPGFLGGPHEVPEIEAPHDRIFHLTIVALLGGDASAYIFALTDSPHRSDGGHVEDMHRQGLLVSEDQRAGVHDPDPGR